MRSKIRCCSTPQRRYGFVPLIGGTLSSGGERYSASFDMFCYLSPSSRGSILTELEQMVSRS
jgi:hypothetical protein